MTHVSKILVAWIFILTLFPWQSYAESTTGQPLFSEPELEQLVAPIALYPDPLLAQILMASTYPLDVVSAARWMKTNANLTGTALQDALQQQTWDDSVKSLTTVPDVLNMMNDKLDMTQKLGDAFLAQQKNVLNAVQVLRAKAQAANHLSSSNEQVVTTAQDDSSSIINIQPADPNTIYVPTYDPNVIYGTWPDTDYPPDSYYPPGYVTGTGLLSFATGALVGDALWGNLDWGDGAININPDAYNRFNHRPIADTNWAHDPAHRGNVPYRDAASQAKYGQDQQGAMDSRKAFEGSAEQGRQELRHEGVEGSSLEGVNRSEPARELERHNAPNLNERGEARPFDREGGRGEEMRGEGARGGEEHFERESGGGHFGGGGRGRR